MSENRMARWLGKRLRRALAAMGTRRTEASRRAGVDAGSPPVSTAAPDPARGTLGAGPGEFVDLSHSGSHGTRAYKLYVPKVPRGRPLPLLVMLHGCTQDPDDMAAGTRMNELADQQGFFVVYPAQSRAANGMNCWNWFERDNQVRDRGEPALIAGITREIMSRHGVDPRRVFIAGMSAGGAMAVIMATVYPELFAALGVHSGLAYGAAQNATTAFAVMRAGSAATVGLRAPARSPARPVPARAMPTIVFHGDADTTVDPSNGAAVVDHAVSSAVDSYGPLAKSVEERRTAAGREYTTTRYRIGDVPVVEHWQLRGLDHAWSGGSASGSFTEASGPDASAEMVRFFSSQGARG